MKRWYLAFGVVLLVAAVFWIYRGGNVSVPTFQTQQSVLPDLLIENARAVTFGDDGSMEYEIQASHMEQYDSEGRATMSEVNMTSYLNPSSQLELRATAGEIFNLNKPGEERIEFRDGLHLVERIDGVVAMSFDAERVTLLPRRNFARSDYPVTMTQGTSKIRAEGFEVDFETRWVHFVSADESQVHAEIEVPASR